MKDQLLPSGAMLSEHAARESVMELPADKLERLLDDTLNAPDATTGDFDALMNLVIRIRGACASLSGRSCAAGTIADLIDASDVYRRARQAIDSERSTEYFGWTIWLSSTIGGRWTADYGKGSADAVPLGMNCLTRAGAIGQAKRMIDLGEGRRQPFEEVWDEEPERWDGMS